MTPQQAGGDRCAVAGAAVDGDGLFTVKLVQLLLKVGDEDVPRTWHPALRDFGVAAHVEHQYISVTSSVVEFVRGPLSDALQWQAGVLPVRHTVAKEPGAARDPIHGRFHQLATGAWVE